MIGLVGTVKSKIFTAAAFVAGAAWGVSAGYSFPKNDVSNSGTSWNKSAYTIEAPVETKRHVLQPPKFMVNYYSPAAGANAGFVVRKEPQNYEISRRAALMFHYSQAKSSIGSVETYSHYGCSDKFSRFAIETANQHLSELYNVCIRHNIGLEPYIKLYTQLEMAKSKIYHTTYVAPKIPIVREPVEIRREPPRRKGELVISEANKRALAKALSR